MNFPELWVHSGKFASRENNPLYVIIYIKVYKITIIKNKIIFRRLQINKDKSA